MSRSQVPALRAALLAASCALLLALPLPAAAQVIGRVLLAVGEVFAERGGVTRPLAVGAPVENRDTVRVGASSNAQIRFNDESVVALRPDTTFRIEEFNYAGRQDGAERAVFNLIAGGMRTVTGLVGRINQRNYQVRTATSTIGIRGTNYNLVHCDAACANPDGSRAPSGTYGGVYDGSINVGNQTGDRTFGNDEFFFVAGPNVAPQSLIAPPSFLGDRLAGMQRTTQQAASGGSSGGGDAASGSGLSADGRAQSTPAPPTPPVFVSTETRTDTGSLAVVSTGTLPFTHALLTADIGNNPFEGSADLSGVNVANMTFSGSGANQTLASAVVQATTSPTSQEGGSGKVGPGGTADIGYGSVVEAHWGRWVDGSVTDSKGVTTTPPGGVHYLYSSMITPAEVISAKSGNFSYNVNIGGTSPTDQSGAVGSFQGGSVSVNFTTRIATSGFVWQVGGSTYSFSGQNSTLTIANGVGASFEVRAQNIGSCSGSCGGAPGVIQNVKVKGVFLGTTGNHLGTAIATTNGTQATTQVRLFYCPTCP
jgi:hypothetical protein